MGELTTSTERPPLLSIGIPVYNGARYLAQAIDSVLHQTFTDFELLISDNCSVDDTAAICDGYARADPRVKSFHQSVNIGAHRNFLFLVERARARYFAWLAHDDYYEADHFLAALYAKATEGFALAFPRIKVASPGSLVYQASGVEGLPEGRRLGFALNEAILRNSQMSHQFYGLYDLEEVPELARVFEADADLRCFNEGRLLHWIFSRHPCAYVPEAVLVYRVHSDNMSRKTRLAELLPDFVRYTGRVLRVYADSPYTVIQRLQLIGWVTYVHGRYTMILILGLARAFLRNSWQRMVR